MGSPGETEARGRVACRGHARGAQRGAVRTSSGGPGARPRGEWGGWRCGRAGSTLHKFSSVRKETERTGRFQTKGAPPEGCEGSRGAGGGVPAAKGDSGRPGGLPEAGSSGSGRPSRPSDENPARPFPGPSIPPPALGRPGPRWCCHKCSPQGRPGSWWGHRGGVWSGPARRCRTGRPGWGSRGGCLDTGSPSSRLLGVPLLLWPSRGPGTRGGAGFGMAVGQEAGKALRLETRPEAPVFRGAGEGWARAARVWALPLPSERSQRPQEIR